ncbi:MAG: hypothetical protein AAB702_00345 [Patescibacteria group bacterium]
MREKEYPHINNLGKNCKFWQNGCLYPRAEMIGRTSCEGLIDDVCLYLLTGRKPKSLSEEQIDKLKLNLSSLTDTFMIPPGDIEA